MENLCQGFSTDGVPRNHCRAQHVYTSSTLEGQKAFQVPRTVRGQSDPFHTEVLWVEDHNGVVVFLQEDGVHGGFAVAPHLKLPGVTLTPYQMDDEGIWVGKTVVAPGGQEKRKQEL